VTARSSAHDRSPSSAGGNAAVQTAVELAKIASSVALVVRSTLKCDEIYIARAKEVGVQIFPHSEVSALHGEATLTGITVRDRETGKETVLNVEGLFLGDRACAEYRVP